MLSFQELSAQFNQQFDTQHFPATPNTLYAPGEYFLTIGGKRIRPVMCMMGNELFSDIHPDAFVVARAIELFHNFTLVHDDMMDEASLRRGKQTVHTKYDYNTALLVGDVMIIRAYEFLQQGEWELNHLSFEELVKHFHSKGIHFYTDQDVFWWPQHRFVTIKKIVLVDKIIRYENLDQDWPLVQAEIMKNVPPRYASLPTELKRENPSHIRNGKSWESYYTPELKEMVYEMYQRDFEIFEYKK